MIRTFLFLDTSNVPAWFPPPKNYPVALFIWLVCVHSTGILCHVVFLMWWIVDRCNLKCNPPLHDLDLQTPSLFVPLAQLLATLL